MARRVPARRGRARPRTERARRRGGCAGCGTAGRGGWDQQGLQVCRVRRVNTGRRNPLEIRNRRLRLCLGGRRVVDDLTLVRGDRVERVEHDRRVVEGQPTQRRSQPLPADFGTFVVLRCGQPGRGLEGAAADELDRVGELGDRYQAVQCALGRIVDVVEVGDPGAGDVQNLFDVLALIAQHLRQIVELVDRPDQCRVVLLQKAFDVTQRLVEGRERLVEVGRAVGEHL